MNINSNKRRALAAAVVATAFGIGAGIGAGSSGGHTTTTVPGPTVTQTVPVPGPTVTQTQKVQAPPPPAGAVLHTFKGSGNQVTPAFNVPDSGNYIVRWSFSGNVDTSFGDSQPSNFIISNTGDGIGIGLANVVQAAGSGSTEVTDGSGTDSLNVQAAGSWTITIVSAS
jgi:hypothetical protein